MAFSASPIIQEPLKAVMSTLELFSESEELEGVLKGLNDVNLRRIRFFAEVKAALKEKHGKKPEAEEIRKFHGSL